MRLLRRIGCKSQCGKHLLSVKCGGKILPLEGLASRILYSELLLLVKDRGNRFGIFVIGREFPGKCRVSGLQIEGVDTLGIVQDDVVFDDHREIGRLRFDRNLPGQGIGCDLDSPHRSEFKIDSLRNGQRTFLIASECWPALSLFGSGPVMRPVK